MGTALLAVHIFIGRIKRKYFPDWLLYNGQTSFKKSLPAQKPGYAFYECSAIKNKHFTLLPVRGIINMKGKEHNVSAAKTAGSEWFCPLDK